MLLARSSAALLGSLLVFSAHASAEPALATPVTTPERRRDPHGVKGISPFREALERGDRALLARDFEAAIVAYREAIAQEPHHALGHYRVGEAALLQGDLHQAEEAFGSGLRLVTATQAGLKAKLQFVLADLRERQKAYDPALAEWSEYEAFTAAENSVRGFPASGSERRKVLEAWKNLSADALKVKARIEKGVRAADEAVRKSSP